MTDKATIDSTIPPSGTGCVECLATPDGWWFHLRRCVRCGYIGCCDQSPSQHTSKHAAAEQHPVIRSFENLSLRYGWSKLPWTPRAVSGPSSPFVHGR